MYEEVLRKELERLLGNYIPNKADMDNLSSYLYKVVVSVFKDADMKKEYKGIKSITQLDEDGFKKAVRDIALFTSQRVLVETLNRSYKELKNVIPMVAVDNVGSVSNNPLKRVVNNSTSEAEFSIDVKSVPKVKVQKKAITNNSNIIEKKVASEFDPNVEMNFEEINKNISKSSSSGEDLTLGAGIAEGEGFSSVPDIDISLDY